MFIILFEQITEAQFSETKTNPNLADERARIQQEFGIDWASVSFNDLREPLVAGLAAGLHYLSRLASGPLSQLIGTIPLQASFWRQNGQPDANEQSFNNIVTTDTNLPDLSK